MAFDFDLRSPGPAFDISLVTPVEVAEQAELNVEWATVVSSMAVVQLEAAGLVEQTASHPIEATKGLLQQAQPERSNLEARGFVENSAAANLESFENVEQTAQIPFESPLIGHAELPIEWKRVVSQTASGNVESRLAAVQPATIGVEWLKQLGQVYEVVSEARVPLESKRKDILSTASMAIEATKGVGPPEIADPRAIIPIEWYTVVGTIIPLEWKRAISQTGLANFETLEQTVTETAELNYESVVISQAVLSVESKWVTGELAAVNVENRGYMVFAQAEMGLEAAGFPEGEPGVQASIPIETQPFVDSSSAVTLNVESAVTSEGSDAVVNVEWEWTGRNVGSEAFVNVETKRVLEIPGEDIYVETKRAGSGGDQVAEIPAESVVQVTQTLTANWERTGPRLVVRARIRWERLGLKFNVEALGYAAQAAQVGIESGGVVDQSAVIHWENRGLQIEQTQQLKVEALSSVVSAAEQHLEARGHVSQDEEAPLEANETAGPGEAEIPVEASGLIVSEAQLNLEAAATIVQEAGEAWESNEVAGPGEAEAPVEATGYTVGVAPIPVESKRFITQTATTNWESLEASEGQTAELNIESNLEVEQAAEENLEWLIALRDNYAEVNVESVADLSGEAPAPIEALEVAGPGEAEAPYESTLAVETEAEIPIEASPGAVEEFAIVPVEALQTVRSTATIRWERTQRRSRAASEPVEATGYRTSTGTINVGAQGFLFVGAQAAFEALVGLEVSAATGVESAIAVAHVAQQAYEALARIRGVGSAPVEALQRLRGIGPGEWEFLIAAGETASIPWEIPYVVTSAPAVLPWESTLPTTQSGSVPLETLVPAGADAQARWESVAAVARQALAAYEALASASESAAVPVEALEAILTEGTENFEAVFYPRSEGSSSLESLRALVGQALAAFEALAAGGPGVAPENLEAAGDGPQSTAAVNWESGDADGFEPLPAGPNAEGILIVQRVVEGQLTVVRAAADVLIVRAFDA